MGDSIVDITNSGAQGVAGVLGGMMVAGTAIAATGAVINMMDRMGNNMSGGGGGRGRGRRSGVKKTGSKKCPFRQAYGGIKEGGEKMNSLIY